MGGVKSSVLQYKGHIWTFDSASSPYHSQPCLLQLNGNTTQQRSQKTPCKESNQYHYYNYRISTLYFNAKNLEASDRSQTLPKEKILPLIILLQVQKHPGKINAVLSGWIFVIRLQASKLLWRTAQTGSLFLLVAISLKSPQFPSMKMSIKRKDTPALTGSHRQRRIVT